MSEYTEQAENFLAKHNMTFRAVYVDHAPYFDDDKESRDIYNLTITAKDTRKKFTVRFGQSINGTQKGDIPTAYDMLTSITKSDPYTFEDFCSEYGYDEDSRQAEKTYKAVKREWVKVSRFFTDEQLEEMQEIQ